MKAKFLLGAAIFLLLTGCSSSLKITHSWKSEMAPEKTYNKIMVIALLPEKDRELRESMENHLVDDLQNRGYNAVSSLKEVGPQFFQNLQEREALDKIKGYDIDAVVTVVLLDKERERYYVPGRIYYSPYAIYQRRFWGYYTTIYGRIYTPGYYISNTKYFWESNFYDIESKGLLYSVQTESFDPSSAAILAHEYGLLIVNDMVKKGIIK